MHPALGLRDTPKESAYSNTVDIQLMSTTVIGFLMKKRHVHKQQKKVYAPLLPFPPVDLPAAS
jgi:hypothetical protein